LILGCPLLAHNASSLRGAHGPLAEVERKLTGDG